MTLYGLLLVIVKAITQTIIGPLTMVFSNLAKVLGMESESQGFLMKPLMKSSLPPLNVYNRGVDGGNGRFALGKLDFDKSTIGRKVMEATRTKQHVWSKMVVTPVEVMPDDKGQPTEVVVEIGDEQVVIGCFNCNASVDEGWGKDCRP